MRDRDLLFQEMRLLSGHLKALASYSQALVRSECYDDQLLVGLLYYQQALEVHVRYKLEQFVAGDELLTSRLEQNLFEFAMDRLLSECGVEGRCR